MPRGKWKKSGEEGHVILGGLDGDDGACKLIREGYVDSTGVQDVYLEAKLALDSIQEAIAKGEARPNAIKLDPGFALSQANYAEKGADDLGLPGPRRQEIDARRRDGRRWRARPSGSLRQRMPRRGTGIVTQDDSHEPVRGRRRARRSRRAVARRGGVAALLPRPARLRILHPLPDHRLFRRRWRSFFPDLVTARNISNQLSNVWPLLAVAIGQTFVIIIAGIDLSQGAIMGFVSVAGALVMATGGRPEPPRRQPALGHAAQRERRLPRRAGPGRSPSASPSCSPSAA